MGQGIHTALAQISAEALGIELNAVRVISPDTEITADAGASVASRQTFISGNAVVKAAAPIREALLETASEETGISRDILQLRGGHLFADGELLPLRVSDLARKALEKNRCLNANGYYSMEYPEEIPASGYPYAHAVFTFGTQGR